MTKKDLIEEGKFEEIKKIIAGKIRPNVKILTATKGNLLIDALININAEAENDLDSRHSHHEEDHANGLEHEHDDHIDSVVVEINAPHTPDSLIAILKELVEEFEIYRIKGFIHIEGKPMRMVLQGVANRFDYYFDRKWSENEDRKTRLVIIGEELKEKDLQSVLNEKLEVSKV